ncbi:MAG: sugar ABC transporter ATP-binding protein [Spirochaetales bacterium]|nr:MAG: sugar ABC transporter ATP-binding protein [Spirochaetales bacterium]
MKNNTILEILGLDKFFPGVHALIDFNIDLREGEVHAVCGENGAGKSTLMKIITGVYQPDNGKMMLNGKELVVRNPNDAYAQGLAIIFQETSLFPDLTILENLFMGHEICKSALGFRKGPRILNYPAMREKAKEIFGRLGMEVDFETRVIDLGVAVKQMVEIAKALTFDSRILILDEPTAALTSKEVDTLFDTIRKLKSHGVSMLYISHRLDEIFQIADRVTVIRDGEHIKTADVKNVEKEQLVAWMVGRSLHNLYPKEKVDIGEIVFEARGVRQDGVLYDVDIDLRKGEILGLSGLAGAGRTELALTLCGLVKPDAGDFFLNGKKIRVNSYKSAMSYGLVYISEDRQKYGLIIPMTVKENITLPLLRKITSSLGIIDFKKEKEINDTYMHSLAIKAPNGDFIVNNLSGGNQQKVSVAKALAVEPQILILDEPTRGVDVGAKSEIHKIISSLAKAGKSIIMISSDLPEILGMSDRVVVMKGGRKMGELMRNELNQEKILKMAL